MMEEFGVSAQEVEDQFAAQKANRALGERRPIAQRVHEFFRAQKKP